jgi:Tfp pilus assembly PilM family ATPase
LEQDGIAGMTKLSELLKVFKRNYSDVLGVDVGASATKVVRIKRLNESPTVVAADILPTISLLSPVPVPSFSSQLPKGMKSRYVALATSGSSSIIKLLTFPPHAEKTTDDHVNELMGLGNSSDYRVGYEPVMETRVETRVLAVALPDATARALCGLFPEGIPAPCSVEISGLASLTAYQKGPGALHREDCVAMIDFGAAVTLVSFFFKGSLVLIRKFDFGANNILKKLQDNLGVDQEVAAGILNDGSFDVSRIVHQAMDHFLQQLVIAWDYVERRENTRIGKLYVTGGGVSLRLWVQEVESSTGQAPVLWNPFEGMVVQTGVFPDRLKGQEGRFSAAVGAALGMLRQ